MAKGELASILGLGAAASAIGGGYKFAEFLHKAKRMKDVGKANAVYVRSIQRVRRDLDEVKRLLSVPEVKDALSQNRPKAEWVFGIMKDTRVALENIIPHTEKVAEDQAEGSWGIRHRFVWLISEKEKLANREKELNTVHTSLGEVLGFLTGLEPVQVGRAAEHKRDTRIDVEYEKGGRRYEEREVHFEHEHAPTRIEEREVHIEREGPRRVEEREVHIHRGPREEERYYDTPPQRYEEREVHYERDPRHVEAQYYEQRGPTPPPYEERRYERSGVLSPDEDREPEHDNWMHHTDDTVHYRSRAQYQEPREYGYFERRQAGDPGFGDQEVLNPQPVPPVRGHTREVWVEEKEDYRRDQYGNIIPESLPPRTRYPRGGRL